MPTAKQDVSVSRVFVHSSARMIFLVMVEKTCTDRGRCIDPGAANTIAYGDGGPEEAHPEVSLANPPQTVLFVQAGDTTATFTLELEGNAPESGIAYRLQRDDDGAFGEQVRLLNVTGNEATFQVPVGVASPDGEMPKPVRLDFTSAIGNLTLALVPEPPADGRYGGTVRLETFGTTGLPIQFDVVTEPDGATLSDATNAWMVLPVSESNIFSPARGADVPSEIAIPLEFDDFTETWVATTAFGYDLSDGVTVTARGRLSDRTYDAF